MFKLPYTCAQFTCQQGNAQNTPSQAPTLCELRTFRCTSWILKRQKIQKSNCQHLLDNRKSKGIKKIKIKNPDIYLRFIDDAKADCQDHNKLWKILKEMGIPDHLTFLLRNLYAGQETTELDMEQQTGSKLRKEYITAVYCHPAYLTYIKNTSCEIPG